MNGRTSRVYGFLRMGGMSAFFFVLLHASLASAAGENGTFVVRPAKVEMTIAAGKEESAVLTLTNGTNDPLHVEVSYEDVAANTGSGVNDNPVVLLGTQGGSYPLKELFSTPKRSFDILSGKDMEIPVKVRVPSDTEPGGHYGSVILTFTPIHEGGQGSAQIAVESRIATLFFVRVSGAVKEDGAIAAFGLVNNETMIPAPSASAPLRFHIAFENKGAVHLNPYGRLTITPLFGSDIVLPIDPWVILPGGVRTREITTPGPLRPGYYTAHLEENRGYGNIVDERTVHFWVTPTLIEGVFFIVILLIVLYLFKRSLALSRNRTS